MGAWNFLINSRERRGQIILEKKDEVGLDLNNGEGIKFFWQQGGKEGRSKGLVTFADVLPRGQNGFKIITISIGFCSLFT